MHLNLYDGLYTAGLFDSSITFAGVSVTSARKVHHYELELFAEDGGVTHLCGEPHPIRAGCILCARPGDVRFSELPLRAHYVKIRTDNGDLCRMLDALPRFFASDATDALIADVHALLDAEAKGDTLLGQARFLCFLAHLQEAAGREVRLQRLPQERGRAAVSRGLAFMEQHFREKCTLEQIAAHVHFSPVYFHGLFETAIGKTPYEYLTRLRIEQAKRLLTNTSLPMAQIAEECGFSSQSYFNYAFRRAEGTTPRAWRRHLLERYFAQDGQFEKP